MLELLVAFFEIFLEIFFEAAFEFAAESIGALIWRGVAAVFDASESEYPVLPALRYVSQKNSPGRSGFSTLRSLCIRDGEADGSRVESEAADPRDVYSVPKCAEAKKTRVKAVQRSYSRQFRSVLSFAFASALVCHCILEGASAPAHSSEVT